MGDLCQVRRHRRRQERCPRPLHSEPTHRQSKCRKVSQTRDETWWICQGAAAVAEGGGARRSGPRPPPGAMPCPHLAQQAKRPPAFGHVATKIDIKSACKKIELQQYQYIITEVIMLAVAARLVQEDTAVAHSLVRASCRAAGSDTVISRCSVAVWAAQPSSGTGRSPTQA